MDQELLKKIEYILINCHYLVTSTFGTDFPVAGNIGIFSQSNEEYEKYSKQAKELTKPSNNPNRKYFELINPIIIKDDSYTAKLTHLYIRKFDPTEYGKNKGDIDFIVDKEKYVKLKAEVMNDEFTGASIYDRPGWDTIQIVQKEKDVVAYISTQDMAEKVRVKFDNLTNL